MVKQEEPEEEDPEEGSDVEMDWSHQDNQDDTEALKIWNVLQHTICVFFRIVVVCNW